MTAQELMKALQALITEDPTIADLDVYVWTETKEAYDASETQDDWEGDALFAEGEVMSVIVPSDIDKNGDDLGSYVAIRAVLL